MKTTKKIAHRGRPKKYSTAQMPTRKPLVQGIAIPTEETFLQEWRQMAKDLKKHNIKINDLARMALFQVATDSKLFLDKKSKLV